MMNNLDARAHTRGESVYLDDIPLIQGTLFGAALGSPIAHGLLRSLHLEEASQVPGVVRIFTWRDIPGENQIGGIVPDEPLLAQEEVDFCGMPLAFVVAESDAAARTAVHKITADITPLPVITDPREAQSLGQLILPPRTFCLGDPDAAWVDCSYIFSGTAQTNGQEHLYIETQGAYALPQENGLKLYSSTQSPRATQQAACRVLGLPMHYVEVEVTRLGGGFGGKEDQANAWGALCALAAYHLQKPVKYALHRLEDMAMTGKRHPYSSDFKIGLNQDLKILAYEVSFYQNAGATADLSPAVLERTLFHCTNTYYIPHVRARAYSCRTHLPPNTAFRGFGGPQGMFVIEAAIATAAEALGLPAATIQQKNLLQTGDTFPYGQQAQSEARACWSKAETHYNLAALRQEVEAFNAANPYLKKGLSLMPICFGISFTTTAMNQARALVHIYTDGSVSISSGAVEMGQGVTTKLRQVAMQVFSLPPEKIRLLATSTSRIANASPSAASSTADLNGHAVLLACTSLARRLREVAARHLQTTGSEVSWQNERIYVAGQESSWSWKRLVQAAFADRVNLSEHAHYATPEIWFDKSREKGHPFAYHVYGTAITEVSLDCLRGTYEIDSVKIVHDAGSSMNPAIDLGQIEGGLVQGIGWVTSEELLYDAAGRLRSNALSTYKVPDLYAAPRHIAVRFLESLHDNLGIFRSKAVGEPPLMYGIGTYFALRQAIRAFQPDSPIPYDAPLTPEKVLKALYPETLRKLQEKYEQIPGDMAVHL